MVIDETEAPTVRRVFDLYLHGLNGDEFGSKQIAAYFNARGQTLRGSAWTRTRAQSMLYDTAYMGEPDQQDGSAARTVRSGQGRA